MKDIPAELFEGYVAFKYGHFRTARAKYKELAAKGQKPGVLIIGCCDSRSAPETIFDAVPGQLFVVRNVANLVPPFEPDGDFHGTSAALEYAISSLKVRDIVVLGHARCGGIAAALDDQTASVSETDFIGKWISLIGPARVDVDALDPQPADRAEALEKCSILHSLANLRTFPAIRALEDSGHIHLHGAYFDIETGELEWFDKKTREFKTVHVELEIPH